jgi:hypothetical protein
VPRVGRGETRCRHGGNFPLPGGDYLGVPITTDPTGRTRSARGMARRVLTVAGLLAVASVAAAPTASAHTVGGNGATNFSTRLASFGPHIPAGITLRVVENGNRLELDNHSPHTVIVLGYGGEPYLRVSPTGVDQNQRSTATYLNTDRFIVTTVPAGVDNTGTDWKHLSDTPTARWHDHRVHWMSASLPLAVANDPSTARQVYPWTIKFLIDGRPVAATGSLNWTPGPSPLPYVLLLAALLAGVGVLLWRRPTLIPAALALLTAADITHTIGVAADQAGATPLAALTTYPALDLVWLAALAAVALTPVRRGPGLGLALVTAGWMTLVGGLSDLNVLASSTAPFAWPISLDRLLTTIETSIGLALIIAVLRAIASDRQAGTGHRDPAGHSAPARAADTVGS